MNKKTKGIILAGGKGTRLFPITKCVSKQLVSIYDKPLIYYPLSILLLANIREILLIHDPRDEISFKELLGDGSDLGISIKYAYQEQPNGLAEALIIAENFIKDSNTLMILGDNIFYGQGLKNKITQALQNNNGATVFSYQVPNPKQFGVIELHKNKKIKSIIEKPKKPKSNHIVTGLYIFDSKASEYAKKLKPSKRNELEITDLNNIYLKNKKLKNVELNRGFAWIDAGNPDGILDASNFIKIVESRQREKIGCIEEIAYRNKFINKNKLKNLAKRSPNSSYCKYLLSLTNEVNNQ